MYVLLNFLEKSVDHFFAALPRPQPSAPAVNNALIIAHRGAHNNKQGIFENTHQAFQRAKELGCWGIECDVQQTADGVLVVHHDPDLLRLWQRNVTIANLNFNELRQIVPEIPSLAEVVAQYSGSLHLLIELKTLISDQQVLLHALGSCKPIQDYHLITLKPDYFTHLQQFPKTSLLLVACHNNVNQFCDLSITQGFGGVLGNYLLLTKKQRQKLQQAQQIYGVGFVNSKNSMYRELNKGTNWLFTNNAAELIKNLHDLKQH